MRNKLKIIPKNRIVAIYLSPREGFGESETKAVKQLPEFKRRNDYVRSIYWEDISEVVVAESSDKDFIESGFKEVNEVIKLDNEEKYPLVGDRVDIDEIMRRVREKLQESYYHLLFCLWREKEFHEIYTGKSPLNVSIEARFCTEKEKPYKPVKVKSGNEYSLELWTSFKLTQKAEREPNIRERWKKIVGGRSSIDVPGIGTYRLEGKFWQQSQEVTGSKDEIVQRFASVGIAQLDFLKDYL